jgi:hypothetical protein
MAGPTLDLTPPLAQIKKSRQSCSHYLLRPLSALSKPSPSHRNAMVDNQDAVHAMPRDVASTAVTNSSWQRCGRERPSRKERPVCRAGNVFHFRTAPPSGILVHLFPALSSRNKKKVLSLLPCLKQRLTDLYPEMRRCAPTMWDMSEGTNSAGVHIRIGGQSPSTNTLEFL